MELNPQQFGEQLDMFKPAREIVEGMHTGDFENNLGDSSNFAKHWGWQAKLDEAKTDRFYHTYAGKESLYDSVGRQGIKQPVAIRHWADRPGPQLANGHHRVAAAYDQNPDMLVPVVHYDIDAGERIDDWDGDGNNPDRKTAAATKPKRAGDWRTSPVESLKTPSLTISEMDRMFKSK